MTKINLCLYLLTFPVFCLPAGLQADQTDSRLDGLFEVLNQTDNPEILIEVENRIWAIWDEHPDDDAEAFLHTGVRYMNAQYLADAMEIFTTIIQQYPDYAEAWNKRATLYYLMGDMEASISDIDKTLALEPRHFGALSGLGLVYIQQQNMLKAREAFENLLKVHPHSPAARQNLETVNQAIRMRFI